MGTTERVVVEEVWTLRDEQSAALDAIKNKVHGTVDALSESREAARARADTLRTEIMLANTFAANKARMAPPKADWKDVAHSANGLLMTISQLSMATFGLSAVADLGNKLESAGIRSEKLRESLAGSLALMSTRGLVGGFTGFSGAAAAGEDVLSRLREMALGPGGVGDPEAYIRAWTRLAPSVKAAGGSLDDVYRIVERSVPLAETFSGSIDSGVDSLARFLIGMNRMNDPMLRQLGYTKKVGTDLKDWGDRLDDVVKRLEASRDIGEEIAAGTGAIASKASSMQEEEWRKAGERFGKVVTGTKWLAAKTANVFYELFMRDMLEMPDVFPNKDKAKDVALSAERQALAQEEAADSAEELAGNIAGATDAIKEFAVYMHSAGMAKLYQPTSYSGGPLSIEESLLAASRLAYQAGVDWADVSPEMRSAFADLAKGVYDAGLGFKTLQEIANDPLTKNLVPNILKGIMDAALPESLRALRDAAGKKDEGLSRKPAVHVDKVEIKIDARHQDPDRLAAAVYDQFGRKAIRGRTSARTGIAFGG